MYTIQIAMLPEGKPALCQPDLPASERLDGWKEIAQYLERGITTVRRWERDERLPVRRLEHQKRGSVIAYKSELDAWVNSRSILPESSIPPKPPWKRRVMLSASVACLGVLALTMFKSRSPALSAKGPPEIRILTADPGEEGGGTFSPSARSIAYVSDKTLYVKQIGVERPIPIYTDKGDGMILGPAWSPDGEWIALSRTRNENKWELILVSSDGRSCRSLGPGGPAISWLPASKRLLLAHRAGADEPSAIFELDIETGVRRQVSFPPSGSWGDIAAAASSDGQRLVIARYPSIGNGDIYVSRIGEPSARQLTQSQTWMLGVGWSPDNQQIVFGGNYRNQEGLFLLPANGSAEPVRIAGTEGRSTYPKVGARPDGSWLISYEREVWNTNLMSYDTVAKQVREIAVTTQTEEWPDLTRDGQSLVFMSARSGVPNLWVCHGDCATPSQVTFSHEVYPLMAPRWSPDGKALVFCARIGGKPAILRIEPGGQNQRILVKTGFDEGGPSWSSDGKWIYFRSNRTGSAEIWRIPSGGGNAEQVTRTGGIEARESNDGRSIFVLKSAERARLVRHSLTDGSETPIAGLPLIHRGSWTVGGKALFYFDYEKPPEAGWPINLLRFDFSTGERKVLFTRHDHRAILGGLTSDEAGRRFVWSERVSSGSDIYAVEFR